MSDERPWLPTPEYLDRVEAVHHHGAVACLAKGPKRARCVRDPDHGGDHEGSGYDTFGPLYQRWRQR